MTSTVLILVHAKPGRRIFSHSIVFNLSPQLTIWQLSRRSQQQQPQEEVQPPQRLASSSVPGGEAQVWISFNPSNSSELVTNRARRVYFWRVPPAAAAGPGGGDGGGTAPALAYYSPPLVASDFRQAVGDFLASVFVPRTSQVRERGPDVLQQCGFWHLTRTARSSREHY